MFSQSSSTYCYHTPFKVLSVFTKFLLQRSSPCFSAPKDSLPVKSRSNPKDSRSNPNECELECHTVRCTAFNGAAQDIGGRNLSQSDLPSNCAGIGIQLWQGVEETWGDYLERTHCPNTGRGVGPETPIRNTRVEQTHIC